MERLPASASPGEARPLRWPEKHEQLQILINLMKLVRFMRRDKQHIAGRNLRISARRAKAPVP